MTCFFIKTVRVKHFDSRNFSGSFKVDWNLFINFLSILDHFQAIKNCKRSRGGTQTLVVWPLKKPFYVRLPLQTPMSRHYKKSTKTGVGSKFNVHIMLSPTLKERLRITIFELLFLPRDYTEKLHFLWLQGYDAILQFALLKVKIPRIGSIGHRYYHKMLVTVWLKS